MPYSLVSLVAAILLSLRYLALPEATPRSKLLVGGTSLGYLAIWLWRPAWRITAILLELSVSLYVLVYLKLHHDTA